MQYNKLIIISGTPGSGKSTLTKLLVKKLGLIHIDIHDLIKEHKTIVSSYNRSKQSYDIIIPKLAKLIKSLIKKVKGETEKTYVFDSHISHLLPKEIVDLTIIMRCSNLKKLKKRLINRKYSKKKVEENVECEIFDVCYDEAKDLGHKIITFDTSKKESQKPIILKVQKNI
jgi:adenylate kinase